MSDPFATAQRCSVWTQPSRRATPFTAWGEALRQAFDVPQDGFDVPPEPIDVETIAREAFEAGHADGLAAGRAEADVERTALRHLAASLQTLRPEPTQALGGMIAATVERLLADLMGTVEIDRALLIARAEAAAALIGEETRPATLRLNPADLARLAGVDLPVAVEADADVAPGSLRLETVQGWIEDGPALRLEKLRQALDRVAVAR